MRNSTIILLLAFVLYGFGTSNSIYELTIRTIHHKEIKLETFKGKKMIFLMLTASIWNNSFINELNSFTEKYKNDAVVIGIISNKSTGRINVDSLSRELKQRISKNILFTHEAFFQDKSKDSSLSLLTWLTDKNLNRHFDVADLTGKKFFVDEAGVLYAVTGPESALSGSITRKIMEKPTGN